MADSEHRGGSYLGDVNLNYNNQRDLLLAAHFTPFNVALIVTLMRWSPDCGGHLSAIVISLCPPHQHLCLFYYIFSSSFSLSCSLVECTEAHLDSLVHYVSQAEYMKKEREKEKESRKEPSTRKTVQEQDERLRV